MNNKRRKRIDEAIEYIEFASQIVDSVLDEEQDALESMPDNLQSSDRYQLSEDCIDGLESAIDHLYELESILSEVKK